MPLLWFVQWWLYPHWEGCFGICCTLPPPPAASVGRFWGVVCQEAPLLFQTAPLCSFWGFGLALDLGLSSGALGCSGTLSDAVCEVWVVLRHPRSENFHSCSGTIHVWGHQVLKGLLSRRNSILVDSSCAWKHPGNQQQAFQEVEWCPNSCGKPNVAKLKNQTKTKTITHKTLQTKPNNWRNLPKKPFYLTGR